MITKIQSYSTESGVFRTIEEAQNSELITLLADMTTPDAGNLGRCVADFIVIHKMEILDILTMKPTSKPSARKINGGTKRRRPSIPSPQTARTLDAPPKTGNSFYDQKVA